MNNRLIILSVLSVTLQFLIGTVPTATAAESAQPNTVKATPDVIIYRGSYPGWPWVARTSSAKLVCVWREGTVHSYSSTGKLMLAESTDEGKTWSALRTIHDEPDVDDRNIALLPLSDDEWLVCYNTYTKDLVSRTFTLRTIDGGKKWSKPQLVCDLDARTRSAPIKLSTGRLVLPFYRAPGDQSLAALSDDGGNSWDVVEVANVPGFIGDEWDVCEMPDGRLVGIMRNNLRREDGTYDGTFYKTESRDRGNSWSKPMRTNLCSLRNTSPAQIFLHNDRPVVLYSNARMVSVVMAASDDPDLLVWKVEKQLPCYQYRPDGKPIADGSYPVSVSVGDNRRFIVDYQHDGDDHLIAGYFVELPQSLTVGLK